ncbi:DUF5081 family protein [Listeria kieliensis]
MTAQDTFRAEELFLIASAFGGESVFGLPDRAVFQLQGEDGFREGYEALQEKGILNETGELTDGGALVVESLENYQSCQSYVRLNQFLFGFRDDDSENAYLLIEVEEDSAYRFEVMDKVFILQLLNQQFPLLGRTMPEEEKSFLMRELSAEDAELAALSEPDERFLSMEYFHVNEEPRVEENREFYQQYFLFVWKERLIAVDVVREAYYQVSGYWLWNELYRELKFPVKEALENGTTGI